jgi:hypothetical protein
MNNRTIIRLQQLVQFGGATRLEVQIMEPSYVIDADKSHILNCNAGDVIFSNLAQVPTGNLLIANNLVRTAGQVIHAGLSAHPGVSQALDLAVFNPNPPSPIYIQTNVADAESLPWEVLYHPHGEFLSLDDRWPIGRMTGGAHQELPVFLVPPLRVAALIAAEEINGQPEWTALKYAFQRSGLDCQMQVFVAEQDLFDDIKANDADWADVRFVPTNKDDLIDEIEAFRPHIVHIFCHGSSAHGGYLEVATINCKQLGKDPVFVSAQDLVKLKNSAWLVTLSACEGARPLANVNSVAYSLVDWGLPAAIGMREAIDSAAAHVFCGSFYRALGNFFVKAIHPFNIFTMFWASLLQGPRSDLCPAPFLANASRSKQWTLPVFYRRPEDLVIAVANNNSPLPLDEQERLLSELIMVRSLRDEPNTPNVVKHKLLNPRIAEIENKLGLGRP